MTATGAGHARPRRLVARLDHVGDVLLSGPAVRAVAGADQVTFLTSTVGAPAARLLPGVGEVLTFDAPWVAFDPPPVERAALAALRAGIGEREIDEAVVLTSYHQSPLPLALLLREAGVERISATCVDYPGALLDVRGARDPALHEVEQSLRLCAEAGFTLPSDDDAPLSVHLGPRTVDLPRDPYVVVHPGASVSSRQLPVAAASGAVARLARHGVEVVVTGSAGEASLVDDLLARCDLDHATATRVTRSVGELDLAQFAHLLAGAAAVVCGNSGPAHLAAAVATPVVEAFAPVVPPHRWRPWRVPHVLLGRLDQPCPRSCSRGCTVASQPCLAGVTPDAVVDAVVHLVPALRSAAGATDPGARAHEEVDA